MTGLDKPIMVIGTPKSGRSVVADLLTRSHDFHYLVEPLMIWDIGLGRRDDDRRTADEATDQVRDRIVHACRQAVDGAGKRRYLDDLAYHALRLPFVHAILPEAKFIHVVRPPRDVIPEMLWGWTCRDTFARAVKRRRRNIKLSSLPRLAGRFLNNYLRMRLRGRRATWGPRVPGLAAYTAAHTVAETAAYQWRSIMETARHDLQLLPADAWVEVHFDRLIASPKEQTERICKFVGLEDSTPVVDYAVEHLSPHHVYEKKVQPTVAEWAAIDELTEPLRRELGCAPGGTGRDGDIAAPSVETLT